MCRILLAVSLVVSIGEDGLDRDRTELRKKADAIRATREEMRFKDIPWVTDLFEGFRLAREENRPVFLYMITGDPLDDC
jgi:Tat protein secretion system quality control protein TatD with DNase activity